MGGLSEGWVELELRIRDSLGTQAETDWTPEITSFKGAGKQKGPQRHRSGEERFVWQWLGRRDFKAREVSNRCQTWQRKAKKNEKRPLLCAFIVSFLIVK